MQDAAARPLEDVATLTRSIERVFRRLLRLLVGRMSLARILEMVRQIFIEEAEARLRREDPNGNVTMSRLALLAGLDSRTINRVRRSPEYGRPLHTESSFLRDTSPGLRVIDVWVTDPRFSSERGHPNVLSMDGGPTSFQELVRAACPTRGVTHTAVLERMTEAGVVRVSEDQVELIRHQFHPFASGDEMGMVEFGCLAVSQLVDTVAHNIESLESEDPRFFQRGSWTYHLAPERVAEFRATMHAFLERADRDAREQIRPFERTQNGTDGLTAGISLFYFESPFDADASGLP